jgi:hypothetical protein
LGITVGCLLGMLPLMFMKQDKDKEKEKGKDDVKKENESPPAK